MKSRAQNLQPTLAIDLPQVNVVVVLNVLVHLFK